MKSFRDGTQEAGAIPAGVDRGCSPHRWKNAAADDPQDGEAGLRGGEPLVVCLPPAPSVSPGDSYFGLSLHKQLLNMRNSLHLTFLCLSLFTGR